MPTNIYHTPFEDQGDWQSLDLSGSHLGARIELLPPGGTSSVHHYHTREEEHVLMLEGQAMLYLGNETRLLVAGDHVCFAAGVEVAHHLVNESNENVKFLVFGERDPGDVVVYPEHQVMLVKSPRPQQYTYRKIENDGGDRGTSS